MTTKFRVQQRKWSLQLLYQVRQQNLHGQKETQCSKAESGASFLTSCGVSNTRSEGMQMELSDSCLQGAWRSCGCSSGRKGCQHHTAESSPFQLLAQLVTFAAVLPFIFSAPLIFTSWAGWVMAWHSSALPHNLYQHYQTRATWPVCPGFLSSSSSRGGLVPQLPDTQHFPFALFPSSTKVLFIFFFLSTGNIREF